MVENITIESTSTLAISNDRAEAERRFQFTLGSLLPFIASIAVVAAIYGYMGFDNVPWLVAFVMWIVTSLFFSLWTAKRNWPFVVNIIALIVGSLGLFATHPAAVFAFAWFVQLFILLGISTRVGSLNQFAKRFGNHWYVSVVSLTLGFAIWFAFPNSGVQWIKSKRETFPVVDLHQELAFEKRLPTSPLAAISADAVARLDELENLLKNERGEGNHPTLEFGTEQFWRTNTLKQIHSKQYLRFVRTEGQGVSRGISLQRRISSRILDLSPPGPSKDSATQSSQNSTRSLPWPESSRDYGSKKDLSIDLFQSERRLSLDKLHFFGIVDFVNPVGWGWSPEFQKVAGFVEHAFYVPPDRTQNDGKSYTLESLQLITVDRFDEPRAFVLDDLPRMEMISGDSVPTRELTDFERRAMASLQAGEDISFEVNSPELVMVGAIRATNQCLQCHNAQRGELLGAFTYRFSATVPVSPIDAPRQVEQESNVEIKSGTLEVDHGSIYFEHAGSGPAIVFVHGGFGDRRMWDDQFAEFARDFHVVRYDHRGFGKSPTPKQAYSPVDDLVRLLDHLKMDRVHLVGNSMGGSFALDFALLKPERLASIVVESAAPNGLEVPPDERDSVVAVFQAAATEGLDVGVEKWLAHPMVAVASKDSRTAAKLRTMVSDNKQLFQIEFWPDEVIDPPTAKRLAEIRVRTLIVVGDRDTEFVQQGADIAARGIPKAKKIVLPGTDHLPHMLQPNEFNEALKKWLSE